MNDYIARALEKAFPIEAGFWLRLQARYELRMTEYLELLQAGEKEDDNTDCPVGISVGYYLESMDMTPEEFSERSGLHMDVVQGLLDGCLPVIRKIARGLGRAGVAYAGYWMRRQKEYDNELRKQEEHIRDLREHGVPFYPAVRLREYLNEYPYTTAEFAEACGLKEEPVTALLDGRQPVTMDIHGL
ncbi:MAG: hypothetical protein LUE27_08735 [Clostridia bacterium]|nr:hypothetical protein [Clostridia bacterium]